MYKAVPRFIFLLFFASREKWSPKRLCSLTKNRVYLSNDTRIQTVMRQIPWKRKSIRVDCSLLCSFVTCCICEPDISLIDWKLRFRWNREEHKRIHCREQWWYPNVDAERTEKKTAREVRSRFFDRIELTRKSNRTTMKRFPFRLVERNYRKMVPDYSVSRNFTFCFSPGNRQTPKYFTCVLCFRERTFSLNFLSSFRSSTLPGFFVVFGNE